jgi:hypothetical protein
VIRHVRFLRYEKVAVKEYSYYADYIDRLANEADLLATSNLEAFLNNLLEIVKVVALFVSIVASPLGMLASFAIGAALGIVPPLLQMAVADDPDKKEAHLFEAALSLLFEAAGVGVSMGASAIIKRLKISIAYRNLFSYRLLINAGRSIDDVSTGTSPLVIGDGFITLRESKSSILKSARELTQSTAKGNCTGVCSGGI